MTAKRTRSGKHVLIIVQNLPVPFDRRVWLECQALKSAGYEVSVVCPKGSRGPRLRSHRRCRSAQVPSLSTGRGRTRVPVRVPLLVRRHSLVDRQGMAAWPIPSATGLQPA